MVSASDRSWNSATTLYIARKIDEIAAGRKLKILDMGCGEGTILEHLLPYGHDLHGYDLQLRFDGLKRRLGPQFGSEFEQRLRVAPDERTIPFEDQSFDIVYANQVFEHVKFLDKIYSEIARVLRPAGTLITLFPLATYPVELHARIPFAHWIPPGEFRVKYLRAFFMLHLRRCEPGMTSQQSAEYWETILREFCFYRFLNEIQALSNTYFSSFEIDTQAYIQAKIDLLSASRRTRNRVKAEFLKFVNGPSFTSFITHAFGGAFILRNPRTGGPAANAQDPLAAKMYEAALHR